MISMSCTHPDIEEFIDIKKDLTKVTKANISVMVSDSFMQAVREDDDWELSFITENGDAISKTVKAKDLFMKLCENNWSMAEPGILYWDRVENYNLLSEDDSFHYAGVNPCAEEPLPAGGSCLLGSINLSKYVDNDGKFMTEELIKDIDTIVIGMNEVLDEGLPLHPLSIQRETVKDYRQIGIGIMGLADMLIKMGIEYGSNSSLTICEGIAFIIANTVIKSSCELAKKYGAYPMYDGTILNSEFYKVNTDGDEDISCGIRNSQLLCIAPTGSISTMLGISGGIEPIFANSYTRKTESLKGHDEYYKVYTPIVEKYMYENKLTDESELPEYFVTAEDIKPENRIKMQGVWQRHIDASISSTVNLPNSATVEDIYDIYMKAWDNGLKGITVYRDGCDRAGILTTDTTKEEVKNYVDTGIENCIAVGTKLNTGCGSLWVTVYFHRETNQLCHIFLNKGSKGGCLSYMIGLSRLISLAGKRGATLDEIIDQLNSVPACPSYVANKDTSKGKCCPNAIGNALYDLYKQFKRIRCREISPCEDNNAVKESENPICPNCGGELTFTGGCNTCPNCGWSKCE